MSKTVVVPKNKHYPPMTAQHFWFIADVVRNLSDRPSRKAVAAAFADELQHTNPNFRREFFLDACDPERHGNYGNRR